MPGPDHSVVTPASLRVWPLPRPGHSKRSRGRLVVVGGSPSTPGAAMLAGLAALRVGAGVLALAVAEPVAGAVAAALPEASVHGLPQLAGGEDTDGVLRAAVEGSDAVVVGPGLDDPAVTDSVVRAVLAAADPDTRLVLDAFALGVLAKVDGAERIAGRSVLTPNPAEAARLLERTDVEERDGLDVAAEIAARFGAVVSYESWVAAPDGRQWTVPTGHAGLGTSGSGDVLAGAITGLLARGADPAQAACWGTYLHGTAGDRLAARVGRLGFLARELVAELPLVIVETEA
jgi:ADP-dependent NAD(P)H-hydrate dehydratase